MQSFIDEIIEDMSQYINTSKDLNGLTVEEILRYNERSNKVFDEVIKNSPDSISVEFNKVLRDIHRSTCLTAVAMLEVSNIKKDKPKEEPKKPELYRLLINDVHTQFIFDNLEDVCKVIEASIKHQRNRYNCKTSFPIKDIYINTTYLDTITNYSYQVIKINS